MSFKVFYEMPSMSNDDGDSVNPNDVQKRFNIVSAKKPISLDQNDKFYFPTYQAQMGLFITFAVDKETSQAVARVSYQYEPKGIPLINFSGVIDAYRGQGIAQQIYEQLLNRYGKLGSDTHLSPHSFKLWKRLGDKYPGKTYVSNLTNNWKDEKESELFPVDGFSLSDLGNNSHFIICLRNC